LLARLARVILAVALLAGWQAALLHPLEHSDAHGGLVHLGDGRPGTPQSDGSQLCDALAALTACAPHTQSAFEPPVPDRHKLSSSETGRRLADAPPFLAQGPPALL
jgi:hypothetical protein